MDALDRMQSRRFFNDFYKGKFQKWPFRRRAVKSGSTNYCKHTTIRKCVIFWLTDRLHPGRAPYGFKKPNETLQKNTVREM